MKEITVAAKKENFVVKSCYVWAWPTNKKERGINYEQ